MKKVASLRYGVIFKKAFCDPEIFTEFVRDTVGVNIEISKVETEKEFDPPIGYVKSRYDLFAEDTKNRIIVDIQHERYADHYDRFMHYHISAILEQVANAQNYRPRMTVFTIVVLTSGDRHQKDISITDFDPKDLQGKPLGEMGHKIIYLCPKYVNDKTPEPFRTWMLAIQDTLDEEVDESIYKSSIIRKVFNYIERSSITPLERAKMFDEYNRELLYEDKRTEGIKEGREDGIKEGREEGIKEGERKTAGTMKKKGYPIEEISELTGLSVDEIVSIE